MTGLRVRVRFLDGSEVTREFPGLSWDTPGHQKLFMDTIREEEAKKEAETGEAQVHAGGWMETY